MEQTSRSSLSSAGLLLFSVASGVRKVSIVQGVLLLFSVESGVRKRHCPRGTQHVVLCF